MNTDKIFETISENDKRAKGVVSLAIRPNQPSQYGEGSLTGKQLQERFDSLGGLIIGKYNLMAQILSGADVTEYLHLPKDYYGGATLLDLLKAIANANGEVLVKVGGKSVTIRDVVDTITSSVNEALVTVEEMQRRMDSGEFKGEQGNPGKDGNTPYIRNGNWWIGQLDTGVKAIGEDGAPGYDGLDGKSAFQLYQQQHPSYTGTLDDWLASLKAKPFAFDKEYESEAAMNADFNNPEIEEGMFAIISGSVENEENARLYAKGKTKWEFITDLSGATGLGKDGEDGLSAYEIAIRDGRFSGTEDEWLSYITSHTEQISTINGEDFRVFVGTREEYEALENKDNLFALITDDPSKTILEDVRAAASTEGLIYTQSSETSYFCRGLDLESPAKSIVVAPMYNGLPVTGIGGGGSLPDAGFSGRAGVESIELPDSIQMISASAFADCTSLKNVTLSKNIGQISAWAFKNCTRLSSLILPDSCYIIGTNAFEGCTGLRALYIPDSVTTILANAIKGCDNLTVYCESTQPKNDWHYNWNPDNRPVIYGVTPTAVGESLQSLKLVAGSVYKKFGGTGDTVSDVLLNVGKAYMIYMSLNGRVGFTVSLYVPFEGASVYSTSSHIGYYCIYDHTAKTLKWYYQSQAVDFDIDSIYIREL